MRNYLAEAVAACKANGLPVIEVIEVTDVTNEIEQAPRRQAWGASSRRNPSITSALINAQVISYSSRQ